LRERERFIDPGEGGALPGDGFSSQRPEEKRLQQRALQKQRRNMTWFAECTEEESADTWANRGWKRHSLRMEEKRKGFKKDIADKNVTYGSQQRKKYLVTAGTKKGR